MKFERLPQFKKSKQKGTQIITPPNFNNLHSSLGHNTITVTWLRCQQVQCILQILQEKQGRLLLALAVTLPLPYLQYSICSFPPTPGQARPAQALIPTFLAPGLTAAATTSANANTTAVALNAEARPTSLLPPGDCQTPAPAPGSKQLSSYLSGALQSPLLPPATARQAVLPQAPASSMWQAALPSPSMEQLGWQSQKA